LFYLGIGGLVFVIGLVAWFVHGVWQNRDLWADVYVLHDRSCPEGRRVQAAMRLARGPRLDDAQLMEMSLRRDLPDRARYVLAEAVSTEAVARDPRSFALAVSRSPDWPDWLRLVLARRLAYGSGLRYAIPHEALQELAGHSDAMIRLWAAYSLTVLGGTGVGMRRALEEAARDPDAQGELAAMLLKALDEPEPERSLILDRATLWLRTHHPQAARIWARQADSAG
jgi:hypothetical protein